MSETSPPATSPTGAGERLVLIGGLATFAASFVPWYRPRDRFFRGDRTNGWQDPDSPMTTSDHG